MAAAGIVWEHRLRSVTATGYSDWLGLEEEAEKAQRIVAVCSFIQLFPLPFATHSENTHMGLWQAQLIPKEQQG